MHGRESGHRLVDVEELVLLLDERQSTVQSVAPAVVLADELATEAAGLLARVLVPHELVAPMSAGVVERSYDVALVADDEDGRVRDRDLFGDVAPDLRQLFDATDV